MSHDPSAEPTPPGNEGELFSNAFDFAAIGMALVASDGRWLKANQALCEITGYPRDELLALDFQTITHPDDLNADLRYVGELLAGARDTYQMEKRYIRKDGRVIWVLLSVSLVRDAEQQPQFFISQIQDIDARKRAESELATFFTLSGDLLAIASPDMNFERVNGAWHDLLGWRIDEVEGKAVRDLVHPDDRAGTVDALRALAARGTVPPVLSNRYLCRDGGYRWLEWTISAADDGRFYGVARDITERRAVQERLQVLERAVASSDFGLLITDTTQPDNPINYVNRRFEEITGYSAAEVQGRSCRFLQGEDRHQDGVAAMRRAVESLAPCRTVLRNYRKNGRAFFNDISIAPVVEQDGSVRYFVGVIQDVTERYRLEQDLEMVIDQVPFGVIYLQTDQRFRMVNQRFADMAGMPKADIIGRTMPEVLGQEAYEDTLRHLADADEAGETTFDRTVTEPDGSRRVMRVHHVPERDPSGEIVGYLVTVEDITASRQIQDELDHQARHDPLTGLLNRRGFERAIERRRRLDDTAGNVLCVIDLDGFKAINDNGGHPLGDRALRDVAAALRAGVRSSDDVARIGGDEFAVILYDCGMGRARAVVESLIEAVAALTYQAGGQRLKLGASAGLAQALPGGTLQSALQQADKACYRAKRAGGDRVNAASL